MARSAGSADEVALIDHFGRLWFARHGIGGWGFTAPKDMHVKRAIVWTAGQQRIMPISSPFTLAPGDSVVIQVDLDLQLVKC